MMLEAQVRNSHKNVTDVNVIIISDGQMTVKPIISSAVAIGGYRSEWAIKAACGSTPRLGIHYYSLGVR